MFIFDGSFFRHIRNSGMKQLNIVYTDIHVLDSQVPGVIFMIGDNMDSCQYSWYCLTYHRRAML